MTPLAIALPLAALLLALAVALTAWRMVRGPRLADRAVAFDLLGLLAVTGTALVAVGTGHLALLDVALGLGLVGFVGAVGLAAFMVRAGGAGETQGDERDG
jgi:multisubunit Na+/H+ antiporter MnhF subunit